MGDGGAGQKYRLGARIGGGGMAEVFEATLVGAEGFARPVAVKRMLPTLSVDPTFGDMFSNEARIASLLHHANIGAVFDFDRDAEGRYFLVMELIQGADLRRVMDTGRLPVEVSVHIAAEMLRGLDYAHELEQDGRRLGIVHRDISPHNVMVSWDGSVKVVDFGIAKAVAATGASRSGTLKGKLAYMSPEQAGAIELDGRSDVFAVGVVLHEMLSGERLFRGSTEPEILAHVLTQPIPRPSERVGDVPPALDQVVLSMLERDRDARCPNAHQALEGLLNTSAVSPRAGLELERLMRERFPDEVPHRRDRGTGSGAASGAGSAGVRATPAGGVVGRPVSAAPDELTMSPVAATEIHVAKRPAVSPEGATLPASPAARAGSGRAAAGSASSPGRAAQGRTLTADPATPAGPLAVGAADPPSTAPARAPRRPWLAGSAVVVVVALATVVALAMRHSGASAVGTGLDAGGPPRPGGLAVAADAAALAPPAVLRDAGATDAAPAPPPHPAPPDAAPPAPVPHHHHHHTPQSHDSHDRSAAPGKLHVVVTPWAEVQIDGKNVGQTPKTIDLEPGTHHVSLQNREAGKHESVPVKIRSGATTELSRHWD